MSDPAAATAITTTATTVALSAPIAALSWPRLVFIVATSVMVGMLLGSFVRHESLHKVLRDIFTGKDGKNYDWAKVFGALGVLAFIHLSYVSVALSAAHSFDMTAFGIGLGGLIAGVCTGVWVKRQTEPAPNPEEPK